MSNATAAGPSRGLLEVLFGSKGGEEPEADGQGFMNLMKLIKSMNGEKEEQSAELGRTLRETTPGKDGAEAPVQGYPWLIMAQPVSSAPQATADMQAALAEEREKLVKQLPPGLVGSPIAALPGAKLAEAGALPGLKADQVNQALKAKALPPLSPEEMKLLQDVNGKIAQVNAQLAAPVKAMAEEAAEPKDLAAHAMLAKELARKGVDPKQVKSGEAQAQPVHAAPEKILSTEAYLQMQGVTKAPAGKGPEAMSVEAPGPQAQAPSVAVSSQAVAGTEQKGTQLNARKEREQLELPQGAKQAKLDSMANGGFAGSLASQLSPSVAETARKEILLPGKPDEMRNALLAEVGSGISLQAHKGGGEMRLVIRPENLGEVKLKVGTKDGKVEVELVAQNDEVAKMIRSGSKELESSLKEQNLSLAKFEVTVNTDHVAGTDTRSNLSDQFFSQNQSNGSFSQQAGADDGRHARWGGEPGGRQNPGSPGYGRSSEDGGGGASLKAHAPRQAARDQSRRLDVVA